MPIPIDILKQGSRELGVGLSPRQLEQFKHFAELLIQWNRRFNLTRITAPEEIVTKHFLDSLTCLKAVEFPENAAVIDVGTGPGMPGLPLKIARDDISLVLLDSVRKKLEFLEEVARALELSGLETVHSRAEDAGRDPRLRENYDVVTARALGALPKLAELCLPLAKPGAVVLAMKGPDVLEELAPAEPVVKLLGGEIERVVDSCVPHTDFQHKIVVLRKVKETPGRYPRKPAEIQSPTL